MNKLWNRYGPIGLTVLSSLGVVGTGIASAKGGMDIQKIDSETPVSEMNAKDRTKIFLGAFAPAIGIAASTIACIVCNHHLSHKQTVAVASAFGLIDKSYKAYRDEVVNRYGKETDLDIRKKILKPSENADKSERLLWYDSISDRYFYRTEAEVLDAEYHFNRNFALRGCADLNELYEFLGLPPTEYGDTVGWDSYIGEVTYGYTWVDFTHVYHAATANSEAYYAIVMDFEPHNCSEENL